MKTISPALSAHLAGTALTLATCWKISRRDGVALGFSAHDRDITFDLGDGDGPVVYRASTGFMRSDMEDAAGFATDNLDSLGVLDSAAITASDLRAGRYDFAEVRVFDVNHAEPSQGAVKLRRGQIGEVRSEGARFIAELRSLTERYSQEIGDLYTPTCRVDLGDTKCQVRLDPPIWQASTAYTVRRVRDAATGSVVKPSVFNDRRYRCVQAGASGTTEPTWATALGSQTTDGSVVWETARGLTIDATVESVADNRTFVLDYAGDAPDELFSGGLLHFGAGSANDGLKMEIKNWVLATRSVTLFLPMPFDVGVGDPVSLAAGCKKTLAICRDTFDNVVNFRGEPFVPGNDLLFRTPDAQ